MLGTGDLRTGMKWIFPTLFVLCAACARTQATEWPPPDSAVGDTLFADCAKVKSHRVVSPLSWSQDSRWRAYVDVDQSSSECLLKSSLWIGQAKGAYHLAYFMAPQREAGGNGMQILGWMPGAAWYW
jgi:hypothetical protein